MQVPVEMRALLPPGEQKRRVSNAANKVIFNMNANQNQ